MTDEQVHIIVFMAQVGLSALVPIALWIWKRQLTTRLQESSQRFLEKMELFKAGLARDLKREEVRQTATHSLVELHRQAAVAARQMMKGHHAVYGEGGEFLMVTFREAKNRLHRVLSQIEEHLEKNGYMLATSIVEQARNNSGTFLKMTEASEEEIEHQRTELELFTANVHAGFSEVVRASHFPERQP